ncbi:MAG: CoA-binding protein [Anaerolineales bacterium]|nr:CoA-binding protein [Anaerolineales bacterium]
MFDFLKKVPLFANLPDDDLDRLCAVVLEEYIPADEILFTEGNTGDKAYVIMEGEIDILKESGGQMVLLATRKAGEVIGEMSLLDQAPRFASGRIRTDCKLLSISHENLEHLLDTSPSAARVMLSTITNRLRSTELVLRQSEKMAQLGTLTAGIAHELNNPASAARRGSEHLVSAIEVFQQTYQNFFTLGFSKEQWDAAAEYHQYAHKRAAQTVDLDSLERSDREEVIEIWLDKNNIEKTWEYAPILVNLGFQISDLEKFELIFPGPQLDAALKWLCTSFTIFNLLAEINQGTTRIGEIVKSLKSYVYLDQAPVGLIDIHEGLDNTLVMLRSKLSAGIDLERHYAEDLPSIQAYGSELNQVWTNIIDNAVDAMDGVGRITISTSQKDDWVFVEIEDSGPGIAEDVQQKLFSPFFTTKPMGKGTGLGLNISFNIVQKHNGQIKVTSHPGKTRFSVQLPINFEEVGQGSKPLQVTEQIPDEDLLDILKSAKTIAVVGISNRESSPAHTVPKYLQEQGYTIFPINPKVDQVLGEAAHPNLGSLENPPDVVLIFHHSDFVQEIVDQAIETGAKVVWMQEGIINLEAAEIAKAAGLVVVKDVCMRKTHQRLIGGK